MAGLSDEILMAYADGELDPAEGARIESLLANDPALRERLKIFTETGRGLALLFEDHLRAPMPPRFKPFASPIGEEPRIVSAIAQRLRNATLFARLKNLVKPENSGFRLAFASTIALIVGIGLGASLLHDRNGAGEPLSHFVQIRPDRHIACGSLRQLLETWLVRRRDRHCRPRPRRRILGHALDTRPDELALRTGKTHVNELYICAAHPVERLE
jgi:anti-sigma factor RsiW